MQNVVKSAFSGKKILIVEDDPSLISLYKQKFENDQFIVDTALDGEEGLNKAQNKEYSLIILDLMLPKLDGIEVLKRIKSNPDSQKVPILILTNLGLSDVLAEQAKALGADGFIIKYKTSLAEIVKQADILLEST